MLCLAMCCCVQYYNNTSLPNSLGRGHWYNCRNANGLNQSIILPLTTGVPTRKSIQKVRENNAKSVPGTENKRCSCLTVIPITSELDYSFKHTFRNAQQCYLKADNYCISLFVSTASSHKGFDHNAMWGCHK